ncbi:patatin-like phospholipase family protein [Oscillatoria sp. FACHB-1407]|uniref:patatin-like phospholipase family protein n=1 Tax=Oscillatoria sp. FACHB-1407 TaxID=2692847 RepID=UPI0016872A53|nr:patatin-like phospholipase family protein [Oscillatoria sp. FACHB-1407]MBD2463724.1 patatin-like phospholipase family protein [Oscillatoria sp. FACHB-1407]
MSVNRLFGSLLFYDLAAGAGEFYTINSSSGIAQLKRYNSWATNWTHIIPGNFGGNGFTDLLFYSSATGVGEFYTTDGSGGMSLLKRYNSWATNWTHIIPGNFGGNGFTDLLFYSSATGVGEFYTTDGSGGMSLLKRYNSWATNWTHIISGNFGGNGFTDLLFYSSATGVGEFYTTDGSGGMSLLKQHNNWLGWTHIISGNFGGSNFTDLLFYSSATRAGEFFMTDGSGGVSLLRQQMRWPSPWSQIVSGFFSVQLARPTNEEAYTRIRLKSLSGKYLSSNGATEVVPLNASSIRAGDSEEFWLVRNPSGLRSGSRAYLRSNTVTGSGSYYQPRVDLHVIRGDDRGRRGDRLFLNPGFSENNRDFVIVRLNNDGKEFADGDRIALRFFTGGYLSADSSGLLRILEKEVPGEEETFTVEIMTDLKLYWSEQRLDNFSTATPGGEAFAEREGYTFIQIQGRIYMNPGAGRKPLYLFWHPERGDNFVTTSGEGEQDAIAEGYIRVRIEGYILAKPESGTLPLRTYWRGAERNDYFATTSVLEERAAADSNYTFVREEGFILPPNAVPAQPEVGRINPGNLIEINSEDLINRLQIDQNILRNILRDRRIIDISRPRQRRQSNKKALVLSGGGAKGCFEVGAVKRLWAQGYRPDIICGVSVGALNAVKLAEGKDSSAEDLELVWKQLDPRNQGGKAVYSKDYFVNLLLKLIPKMIGDGIDDLLGGTDILNWLFFAASHLHSIHSMHPLRNLISQNLDINAIRASGTKLRIGMTDLRSGQYFSVTEPFEAAALGLNVCGRVEVEPDHRIGETWLTRPILGADSYAMHLEDAIYASCVLPVFMDPKILNLRNTRIVPFQNERIALLRAGSGLNSTYSPPSIERLMSLLEGGERDLDDETYNKLKKRTSTDFDLTQVLRDSLNAARGDSRQAQHHLFDGGLRDTMAIRTAIRLGAREITVITGDRLQTAQWAFKNPGMIKEDAFALPVAQYLFGLLGIWFNEAARTDVLLAVAQNEFLGWLYRCFSLMDDDKRQQIVREFNEYWVNHGAVLRNILGGSTWIGGDITQSYGTPFQDEGCCIKYISPSGELVDALGFDKWEEIQEGIDMGYEAASSPVELSFPVPDHLVSQT